NHNATGFGNTAGYAAIENSVNYGTLMILGRAGTPVGRRVDVWDYLQVNGNLQVTGQIHASGGALVYSVSPPCTTQGALTLAATCYGCEGSVDFGFTCGNYTNTPVGRLVGY